MPVDAPPEVEKVSEEGLLIADIFFCSTCIPDAPPRAYLDPSQLLGHSNHIFTFTKQVI